MKPTLSPVVYLLFALVGAGLLALGIAAYTAFSQVMVSPVQAGAAAVLVEAGMVLETMALIRGNRWSIPGIAVSLAVSGTYNYIQAQQHGAGLAHPLTNWWQLSTLAVGPLAALFSLALAIGYEIRRHEAAVREWEAAQNRAKVEAQETNRAEREKAQRLEAQKQIEIERLRLAKEREVEQARIAAEEKARRLEARREERRLTRRQISTFVDSPVTFARGYDGFVEYVGQLTEQGRALDVKTAAREMNRSERTIERYVSKNGRGENVHS